MNKIFLIVILLNNICFGQIIMPLEKNKVHDLVFEAEIFDNVFYYYNSNHLIKQGQLNLEDTLKRYGNLKVINFNTNEIHNTIIYSKHDSISTILSIIKDNNNNIYTIRSLTVFINDTLPTFYLEKRDAYCSTILENTILPLGIKNINIVNAFFDNNNNLWIKAYTSIKTYYFKIKDGVILESHSANYINNNYFHQIDNLRIIEVSAGNERSIVYYNSNSDSLTFDIQIQYENTYSRTIDKSKIINNTIYFCGLKTYNFFSEPDFDVHKIYKHKINSATVISLFEDSLSNDFNLRSFNGFDLIDTNYIYSGVNLSECFFSSDNYNCHSSFKLYCVNSEGQLNWSKIIGGNANNYLWHILATPDTGCLALFYHYPEIDSALNGDFYWLKYDKEGNQDTAFLSGFNDVTGVGNFLNIEEIILYPNPTNGILNFDYSSSIKNPIIYIFDYTGKLIQQESLLNKQLNINQLSNGQYLYRIENDNHLLKTGKILKIE